MAVAKKKICDWLLKTKQLNWKWVDSTHLMSGLRLKEYHPPFESNLLDPIQDQVCWIPPIQKSSFLFRTDPTNLIQHQREAADLQWLSCCRGNRPTETGVESNIHSSSLATCDLLMSYHSCKMNMNKWVSQTHASRYVGEVYAIQLSRQIILSAQSLFTNPICVIIIHTQKTCLDIPKQDTLRSCKIVTERQASPWVGPATVAQLELLHFKNQQLTLQHWCQHLLAECL